MDFWEPLSRCRFSVERVRLSWPDRLPPVAARLLGWAACTIAAYSLAARRWRRPPVIPDWVAPAAAFSGVQFWIRHTVCHQVYALVFACAALGFVEAARGRDVRADFWLGLGSAAKVTPALALLHFAFTRRWGVVGAAAAMALACSALVVTATGSTTGQCRTTRSR